MDVLIEKDSRVDPFDPRRSKLFELADLSGFLAQVDFPQNMWGKVRKGERARVAIGSLPATQFAGEVLEFDDHINVNTGSFAVRFKIEPAESSDLATAGMFVLVSLTENGSSPEETPH